MRATLPTLQLLLVATATIAAAPKSDDYFRIRVIDSQTGRGVPLVELSTVNNIRLYTDSHGVAAFHEPGLMNTRVFFHIRSHGYAFPKDGFGIAGKRLQIAPGGSAQLRIDRTNVAQRLYRVTGAGIYRDSVLLGDEPPTKEPLLNARVFGSDSVVNALYRGKIYWFWGDTNKPDYPLGNFHVPGATSLPPAQGGLDPNVGVNLRYFSGEDGFAKPTAQLPGKGPTWINGLVVAKDRAGQQRLLAMYVKIKPPLTVYERGLIEFDDQRRQFGNRLPIPLDAPLYPTGHPLKLVDEGAEYIYFGHPFPRVRVRATAEAVRDLSQYEAWSCLKTGSRQESAEVDRDQQGRARFAWRPDTPAVVGKLRQRLIRQQLLQQHEGLIQLQDVATGKRVAAHGGSVYFNEFRQRWIAIILESFGTSPLGEIWYAEADTPLGPWVYARKVVTHDNYSFYNPKQHPMFDQDGGRTIYFEGTYTSMFSGNPEQTPRYNYNQIMYRLDLDDPRLNLPVAVYDRGPDRPAGEPQYVTGDRRSIERRSGAIGWFALDRACDESAPVYAEGNNGEAATLVVGRAEGRQGDQPLFHALPTDAPDPPATAVPLYEFIHETTHQRRYTTREKWSQPGYRQSDKPICLVWRNPILEW